ncbi:MAG: DMT family transporter [Bdellovibrionales bacterium]
MATTTALSWAVLAIALKYALQTFSSGTIVWLRMALAFVLLLSYFLFRGRPALKVLKRPPLGWVLAALLLAANYYGFMKGIELTTASNAQIMIQLAPLSFAFLSIFIFKEVPTLVQVGGMLLALSGFGFFYWDQILVSWEHIESFQEGNLWLGIGSATWAVFALIQKFTLKDHKAVDFNLLVYGVSAFALLPIADLGELSRLSWSSGALILFLGLNTVVAYGAFSEALSRIPASHVSMIIAMNPLLTLAIMTYLTQIQVEWIQGEPIHWRGFLGALFVVGGVILTLAAPARLSRLKTSSTI